MELLYWNCMLVLINSFTSKHWLQCRFACVIIMQLSFVYTHASLCPKAIYLKIVFIIINTFWMTFAIGFSNSLAFKHDWNFVEILIDHFECGQLHCCCNIQFVWPPNFEEASTKQSVEWTFSQSQVRAKKINLTCEKGNFMQSRGIKMVVIKGNGQTLFLCILISRHCSDGFPVR